MTHSSLLGKRILVTHADAFMGPVLCEVLARHGATVIPNTETLREP
ncbi:MAG: short-chain dehydrogenase, partial [Zoogloea sp.]|nr:short-chain dehydrogenase [Zoogloea sp.]